MNAEWITPKSKRVLPNWLLSEERIVEKVPSLFSLCKSNIVENNLYNNFNLYEKHIFNNTKPVELKIAINGEYYCKCNSEYYCRCIYKERFFVVNSNNIVLEDKRYFIEDCHPNIQYTTCHKTDLKDYSYERKFSCKRRLFS